MGIPIQKSAEKNQSVNSTESTAEGSVKHKSDPKNTAEHPKIQSHQVNSDPSERENPICKNKSGTKDPPVSPISGDPKNSPDHISTTRPTPPASESPTHLGVEGVSDPKPEVNAVFAVQTEGSIQDLATDILKTTIRKSPQIFVGTFLGSFSNQSVAHAFSGVPTSGVRGSSNPALEEGEIADAEASLSGVVSNPHVDGSTAVPVSAADNPASFSVVQSAGPASEGSDPVASVVPPPPDLDGGDRASSGSGDPSQAPVSSKSFLEATTGSQPDAVLGSVDFSTSVPTVVFTADECEQVSSFYRFAIIGKFSYRKPSNHMISQLLKSEGFGTCKVHFLNGKHVLINLSSKLLCDKLWMRREFVFAGFPMRMFHWDPFFNFKEEPAVVPLWVKIHALPPQWFDLRSLKTIASSVGEFLKVDEPTHNRSRLSFARVCVEVNLKNHLPKKINLQVGEDSTTASGEASANHDDGFQTVGKGFKLNRRFPPPKIPFVSNVVSNPFDILSQDEELRDGLNLEGSTREPCPLDKDPVASLPNLGHSDPSAVLTATHGPSNHFDQEELIDVVVLEGSTNNTNIFFTQDPVSFQNQGSDHVGTSKTKVMDNQAYYSADELEGFDNYYSDGSVHSGKSLPDQPFSDQVQFPKVVGTEMVLFKNKHKNPTAVSKKGRKKFIKNMHETSNILDKRTRSGAIRND
ncbi:hypothetical protein OROMI_011165 [Orobanche minor]